MIKPVVVSLSLAVLMSAPAMAGTDEMCEANGVRLLSSKPALSPQIAQGGQGQNRQSQRQGKSGDAAAKAGADDGEGKTQGEIRRDKKLQAGNAQK